MPRGASLFPDPDLHPKSLTALVRVQEITLQCSHHSYGTLKALSAHLIVLDPADRTASGYNMHKLPHPE